MLFQGEERKANGYIPYHTSRRWQISEEERYVNPKMEDELETFKKKIALRFSQGQIPKEFAFPRTHTDAYYSITGKNRPEERSQEIKEGKLKSILN